MEVDGVRRAVIVTASGRGATSTATTAMSCSSASPPPRAAGGRSAGSLTAPMPGVVHRVLVAVGDRVDAGQAVVVIEAMKMEHQIGAPATPGRVVEVAVAPGQQVDGGQPRCWS